MGQPGWVRQCADIRKVVCVWPGPWQFGTDRSRLHVHGGHGSLRSRQPWLYSLYLDTSYIPTTPIPEPSTYGLMLVGLSALWLGARRRKH